MRGYDFAVLESYQKLIHNLAKNMDINVEDAWATPAQHLQIVAYKPNSEVLDSKYFLKNYERTIQVTDISAPQVCNFVTLSVISNARQLSCRSY